MFELSGDHFQFCKTTVRLPYCQVIIFFNKQLIMQLCIGTLIRVQTNAICWQQSTSPRGYKGKVGKLQRRCFSYIFFLTCYGNISQKLIPLRVVQKSRWRKLDSFLGHHYIFVPLGVETMSPWGACTHHLWRRPVIKRLVITSLNISIAI